MINKKADKIYLYCCLGLLVLGVVLYKPMLYYFGRSDLYVIIGMLFGFLAAIHFNIFWGVDGWVERIFGTFLSFIICATLIGGLFQGIDWIICHIRIV